MKIRVCKRLGKFASYSSNNCMVLIISIPSPGLLVALSPDDDNDDVPSVHDNNFNPVLFLSPLAAVSMESICRKVESGDIVRHYNIVSELVVRMHACSLRV